MSKIPEDLKYTKSHEWVRLKGDIAEIGISDYAQQQLTDIVFVDFPKVGDKKSAGDVLLTVESVKSAEDVFSPVSGEVTELNKELEKTPELLNTDSYANWIVRIRLSAQPSNLMTADEYREHIGE